MRTVLQTILLALVALIATTLAGGNTAKGQITIFEIYSDGPSVEISDTCEMIPFHTEMPSGDACRNLTMVSESMDQNTIYRAYSFPIVEGGITSFTQKIYVTPTGITHIGITGSDDSSTNFFGMWQQLFWVVDRGNNVGIPEVKNAQLFTVHPNPVLVETVIHSSEHANFKCIISNSLGQTVLDLTAVGNDVRLNRDGLPSGIYFVHTDFGAVQRILVQ